MGDLEFLAEVAPIEIGDRIWNDLDNDGIQDAGEAGFEGVTVSLFDADGNLVVSTTTDAEGKYYFNEDNVTDGLSPLTNYQIRLDNAADFADGGVLNGYDLTVEDANNDGNDTTDSDAVVENVDGTDTPTINVTTGDYGENDYSLDAGFHKPIPEQDITLVGWIDL